jgi:hypothetical protein
MSIWDIFADRKQIGCSNNSTVGRPNSIKLEYLFHVEQKPRRLKIFYMVL